MLISIQPVLNSWKTFNLKLPQNEDAKKTSVILCINLKLRKYRFKQYTEYTDPDPYPVPIIVTIMTVDINILHSIKKLDGTQSRPSHKAVEIVVMPSFNITNHY